MAEHNDPKPGAIMCAMTDAPAAEEGGHHEAAVELRKEAYTMALYVAICLLAALIALPVTGVGLHVAGIIWGVTIHRARRRALVRVPRLGPTGGRWTRSPPRRGVRRRPSRGAAAVAVLAWIPVILFPEDDERLLVELVLAAFIAVVGFTVARGGGATRGRATIYALSVLVLAVTIAAFKNILAGH